MFHRINYSTFEKYELIGSSIELSAPIIIYLAYLFLKKMDIKDTRKFGVFIFINIVCLFSFSSLAVYIMDKHKFPSVNIILIWLTIDLVASIFLYLVIFRKIISSNTSIFRR